MSIEVIPQNQWSAFLRGITQKYRANLVQIQTHDRRTGEDVASRPLPLESIRLDTEDPKNPRINVTVRSDHKEIRNILFRPSHVIVQRSSQGEDEAVRIISMNTVTTIQLRGTSFRRIDEAA